MSKAKELIEKYTVGEQATETGGIVIPKDAVRVRSDIRNSNVGNDELMTYLKSINMKITSVGGDGNTVTYSSKGKIAGYLNEKTKELFIDRKVWVKWLKWADAQF
jgi:hypothetical protein